MMCRGCGAEIADASPPVTIGRRHAFCGTRCRDRWAVDRVVFVDQVLSRIHIRCRGKARKLALAALTGNVLPEERAR